MLNSRILATSLIMMLFFSVAALAEEGSQTKDKTACPSEETLYGVSESGTFFIHECLVQQTYLARNESASEDELDEIEVKMRSQLTGWAVPDDNKKLGKVGDFYYFASNKKIDKDHRYLYVFFIEGPKIMYIPEIPYQESKPGIDSNDVKPNEQGGFNFYTKPVASAPAIK